MAQRSSGIFPREGFNLDESCKAAAGGATTLGVNLAHTKTIRAICLDPSATTVLTVGGHVVYAADPTGDVDANGALIVHLRGSLLADQPSGTVVADPVSGTWYFEKVEA